MSGLKEETANFNGEGMLAWLLGTRRRRKWGQFGAQITAGAWWPDSRREEQARLGDATLEAVSHLRVERNWIPFLHPEEERERGE